MHVLVLGGTAFVGRAFVEVALSRGHEVALANRGVTDPDAFPDVEHIQIDRDAGDVGNLKGRSFDVVVDVNAYVPRAVRQVAEALGDVGRVLFVSTCAVYDVDAGRTGSVGEDWPVVETVDPASEDADALYGELKVLCEREVLRWRPDATLIVRPGFIVGPGDTSDRLLWWLRRCVRGGEILAPVQPDYTVQLIDVRDLGSWMVAASERDLVGTFNAVGPLTTMEEFLVHCAKVAGSDARFTWVDEERLFSHGLRPWASLPFWLGPERALTRIADAAAVANGLARRPIEETLEDLWSWDAQRGRPPLDPDVGIADDVEARILAAARTGMHEGDR